MPLPEEKSKSQMISQRSGSLHRNAYVWAWVGGYICSLSYTACPECVNKLLFKLLLLYYFLYYYYYYYYYHHHYNTRWIEFVREVTSTIYYHYYYDY